MELAYRRTIMKTLQKAWCCLLLSSSIVLLHAENLIKDPDCNADPMSQEFAIVEGKAQGKVSLFVEDATWNHCLKFELIKYDMDGKGGKTVNTGVRFGGNNELYGFPCEPDTTYKFSVEIKGTASRAMINFIEWDDPADNSYLHYSKKQTSIHLIKPQKEWTVYRGTFKTSSKALRAALMIQFWGQETGNQLEEKIGQYILIDKIQIEKEKKSLLSTGSASTAVNEKFSDLSPAAVCVVSNSKETPGVLSDFSSPVNAKTPAKYPSGGTVWNDGRALHFNLWNKTTKPSAKYSGEGGDAIWNDDIFELFFAPVIPDRQYTQLVVSAGGGRWMGNGSRGTWNAYDKWTAKTTLTSDGWTTEVTVPFTLLGYQRTPGTGDLIGFNVTHQHTDPGIYLKQPDFSKGNRWGGAGRMYTDSAWAFTTGNLRSFGMLFFGTMQKYIDEKLAHITSPELESMKKHVNASNPGLAWACLEQLLEKDRILKLSREKFIVAKISPTTDPTIPFMPEELNNPQKEYKLRAAVNEHAPLVLALANMTGNFEEYRLTLTYGWKNHEPQLETLYQRKGLLNSDGSLFPSEKITIRRGVKSRDSESENAGQRYDILTKVNEISSIPVPSRDSGLIWIDFDCHGVKPGVYKGILTVTPLSSNRFISSRQNGEEYTLKETLTKEIPVELEVLPLKLSDDAMPLDGCRPMLTQYYFDFMRQYNNCLYFFTPYYFTFTFNADGTIKEDNLRPYLLPLIRLNQKNAADFPKGVKKYLVGYSTYKIFRDVHAKQAGLVYNTPEFWNGWREWSRAMNRILSENGISLQDYVVEIADEPSPASFPDKKELQRACMEMAKAVPGINICISAGEKHFFDLVKDYVNEWIFSQHTVYNPELNSASKEFRALPGKTWSIYCCGTAMRQDLYRYYRIHPWQAFDLKSSYTTVYQMASQRPGLDFRKIPIDGELAYDTSDTLVPSIRLEVLRIGLTDVQYLRLLETMTALNTPEVAEARAFLKHAAHDVGVVYPHDSGKADEIRNKAIDFMLKLKNKGISDEQK